MSAGYPTFKGQILNGQQLCDIVEGLEANNLLYYTHLLTGIVNTMMGNCWVCCNSLTVQQTNAMYHWPLSFVYFD